jgi:hypothetical protein
VLVHILSGYPTSGGGKYGTESRKRQPFGALVALKRIGLLWWFTATWSRLGVAGFSQIGG